MLLTIGKFSIVAALATSVLCVFSNTAQAQEPLECPDSEDAVLTYPPDYIRENETWIASAKVQGSPSRVTGLTITVEQTAATALAVDDEGRAKIVMPPLNLPDHEVAVNFDWDQDSGTQVACHGSDQYFVPYAKAEDTVGKATTTRLQGSYRVTYSRDSPGPARWKLTPRCDLLACNTRIRSSGGIRGTLHLRGDGTYAVTDDESGYGECTVHNHLTGSVRKFRPAYTRHRLIVLNQNQETEDLADTVTGTVTDTYRPTAAARSAGCTGTTRHSRITLARRG